MAISGLAHAVLEERGHPQADAAFVYVILSAPYLHPPARVFDTDLTKWYGPLLQVIILPNRGGQVGRPTTDKGRYEGMWQDR